MRTNPDFVVLISADAEWRCLLKYFPDCHINNSPYGNWYYYQYTEIPEIKKRVVFIHGGWGKVASAGATQFAISRWHPKMLINIGTCGGIKGEINLGDIILVEKTLIYDIIEQMGDPDEHIKFYETKIDNSWVMEPLSLDVIHALLVSGDRDLGCDEVAALKSKYSAIAGDWESGAIAWVATKNRTQCLILRGVTDLVSDLNGDAYDGRIGYFYENTELIMKKLISSLPGWLVKFVEHNSY
jgi:adenosylhomocysteine nucleosidase